jgi:hypothetical protein
VELKGSIDHIICDPPFLSEDCQTKSSSLRITTLSTLKFANLHCVAALTVRWLSRTWGSERSESLASKPSGRLVVCTGERMKDLVTKLYRPQGIVTTDFEPVHAKGLSNEFYCYANFDCEDWKLLKS